MIMNTINPGQWHFWSDILEVFKIFQASHSAEGQHNLSHCTLYFIPPLWGGYYGHFHGTDEEAEDPKD